MNELPISKFAPFTKEEACFQFEVSNKLKEIEVKCSNCIYVNIDNTTMTCSLFYDFQKEVGKDSLCRFFTNQEEIEDKEEDRLENKPDQEMSLDLQKLDFTQSNIIESIKNLRDKFINE